jgi:hypothetical protein
VRSSALAEIADWFHQTRDMLKWAAIGVGGLIIGLWLFGTDQSTPIRAAEAAVREATNQPDLAFHGSRMHAHPGFRLWLVCGRVNGDESRPFAAVVKKHRGGSALSLISSGDGVKELALPEIQAPTPEQAGLLATCAARS